MPQDHWRSFIHPITAHFRRKRMARFLQLEPAFLEKKILDVGGSLHFWQKIGVNVKDHDITILNISVDGHSEDVSGETASSLITLYDGETIPWPENHFDWVLSNSVIEHVDPAKRRRFSSEIRRVGINFIVQTPSYWFPVEPHFVLPFLHWLPRKMGRKAARFGPWAILGKRSKGEVETYFKEINLLKLEEFRALFPGADLITERVAFFPKSYTLVGHK